MIRVPTQKIQLAQYSGVVPDGLISEIINSAEKLRGMRIVHVNATPVGGGVAEILQSLVPLMCSVGIEAEWYVIEPDDGILAIGSGGSYALAAARSLLRFTDFPPKRIAKEALKISSEICIYTNDQITVKEL